MDQEMKKELDLNDMEQVSGGVIRIVDTGVAGLDAALRIDASKGSKQIGHIANGVKVSTVTDELVWDPVSKRHFVQVIVDGKTGWIASSILGLPR